MSEKLMTVFPMVQISFIGCFELVSCNCSFFANYSLTSVINSKRKLFVSNFRTLNKRTCELFMSV